MPKTDDTELRREMKEPTQGELREFWEWCHAPIGKISGLYDDWIFGDGQLSWGEFKRRNGEPILPDLDLNNLFKYAVPQVGWCSLEHIIMVDPVGFKHSPYVQPYKDPPFRDYYHDKTSPRFHWYRAQVWGKDGKEKIIENAETPELALYHAIKPVMEAEK